MIGTPDANWHALGGRVRSVHGRSMRSGSLLRGWLNVSVMEHTCVQVLHRYFFHGFTVAVVMLCIDCSSDIMGQHHTHTSRLAGPSAQVPF